MSLRRAFYSGLLSAAVTTEAIPSGQSMIGRWFLAMALTSFMTRMHRPRDTSTVHIFKETFLGLTLSKRLLRMWRRLQGPLVRILPRRLAGQYEARQVRKIFSA